MNLKPDVNGIVQEKYLYTAITEEVRKSKLNKYVPSNGSTHKVSGGHPEEYAKYFISIMKKTSKLKANYNAVVRTYSSTGALKEVKRVGLFSVSPQTCPEVKPSELLNPEVNIREGVRLYSKLILREGKLPEVNGVVFI